MQKVQAAVLRTDREQLLDALHDLGILHITPINPGQAVAEGEIIADLDSVRRAVQLLSVFEPDGQLPDISIKQAVDEVASIQRSQSEYDNRLSSLYRQLEQQSIWGDLALEDLETLKSAGAEPQFYAMRAEEAGQVRAEFSVVLSNTSDGDCIVAVIDRSGTAVIPDESELIPWPVKDNPSIRAEAADIDARLKQFSSRLSELAALLPEMRDLQGQLEEKAQFSIAANGALNDQDIFGIEGWAPAERCEKLASDLEAKGVIVAVRTFEPEEDDSPPTLIKYPGWATPIKSLFDMLGTLPGYREIDISMFFMITMPVFAAMLNGDAGYGLIFLLPAIFMYRKVENVLGKEGTQLLIIFGIATLIWGILNANFFGVQPGFLVKIAPLVRGSEEASRNVLIAISFLIGSTHLVVAHLRRILALFPDTRALAEVGWIAVLLGILGVIWAMFPFFNLPVPGMTIMILVGTGLVLVVLFGHPDRNPLKRVGVGFASSLLPMISTFGDTMSYIRLVAVGLASYYIAVAFNDLGAMVAGAATWFAAAPILLFGHALNIVLVVIAIFAHGVRLNMLEFSSHCGVEWSGYAYDPFTKTKA